MSPWSRRMAASFEISSGLFCSGRFIEPPRPDQTRRARSLLKRECQNRS
jgi:hypothetical protein